MGGRSQTANTYLENHFDEIQNATPEDLIKLAVGAMKKAMDIEYS